MTWSCTGGEPLQGCSSLPACRNDDLESRNSIQFNSITYLLYNPLNSDSCHYSRVTNTEYFSILVTNNPIVIFFSVSFYGNIIFVSLNFIEMIKFHGIKNQIVAATLRPSPKNSGLRSNTSGVLVGIAGLGCWVRYILTCISLKTTFISTFVRGDFHLPTCYYRGISKFCRRVL